MPAIWKKIHLGSLFRAVWPWFLILLGVGALGFLFYFVATLGPKRVTSSAVAVRAPDDPAVSKLSDEISDLEKQYRQAADANLVTPEAIEKLAQALEKQRELVRIYPAAGLDQTTRLMRLETTLDGARAKVKMDQIEILEKEGEDLQSDPDTSLAEAKLSEALRLQREINTSSASSRYKNYVRETSLVQALAAIQAAPLKKQVDGFLVAARKAAAEMRWSDALAAYTAARDMQERINREYARTRFADLAGADTLSAEIESLNAAGIVADIDAKEKAGDVAAAQGKGDEAATLFAAAGALQLQVNQNFKRSRFVSSERIEALEVKRQTALSAATADALATLDRVIGEHLKKRQVVAAEQKIGEAVQRVDQLFADYPKSQRIDGALKLKIAYLALRRADLRMLQDEVYDRLLPLPGVAERLLLKTEVPQSLYVLVMNTNPSRNPGRTFPVDSVNWNDAQEFCARLSWLLGVKVRLPTLDEFRVALGDGDLGAWGKQNSNGRSQEVGGQKPNAAGFYDLLGNLAEWSAAGAADDKAFVLGGSYLDEFAVLVKIPSEERLKSDRARHVGFRILVETDVP
jgi:hypothetical protein